MIPIPPDDLIFLVAGHRDRDAFALSGRHAVETLLDLLGRAGASLQPKARILDFGCGCGRLLAGWDGRLPEGATLDGCDINPALVRWCRDNLPDVEVIECSPVPPLPYLDDTLDLVYAASVYTHLTLPAMLQWTGELTRIVKPGGVAVVSIHGSYYWRALAENDPAGHRHLTGKGWYVQIQVDPRETFLGSNHYATFATPGFMERIFVGFDLLLRHDGETDGPTHFGSHQDILVFRRT